MLTLYAISPFYAVKEIVAEAIDDDEQAGYIFPDV